jgi:hypothetical protein
MRPEVEAGPRLPGTGFQVRCPAFGPDEGQGKVRISPIPPSMVEGRIPAPGLSRGPSRQRARPIAFSNPHPLSCIPGVRVFQWSGSVFGARRRTGSGAGYQVPGAR